MKKKEKLILTERGKEMTITLGYQNMEHLFTSFSLFYLVECASFLDPAGEANGYLPDEIV